MGVFIYLIGFPGVGKLTVAKELSQIIPNSKVFDNHLIIDPASAIVERNMPEYVPLRISLRKLCLDAIANSQSTKHISWIFTDSQTSDGKGAGNPRDYQEAAISQGAEFISVVLNCDLEENIRRVGSRNRIETRGKLTDEAILESIYKGEPIFRFGKDANEIEIDVSHLAAKDVAELIASHVRIVASKST
ncbi:hypothetical protein BT63DRAFT_441012 [Microthyrium microscopicum]|uniref:P-loop containing nucleoside triphosphate hydrolase protein n=1 Tax=Microthyrium microscopicum TaxID=703497 RepID=A0A6A6U8A7_9PEZI|nr:hypothetical protein BT63DRAFT_441012 [Microthyrium microscopicum]